MKIRQMKVPEVYQPILIVMLMSVIQQFSGMSILRAYVVKIFDNIFDEDATSNEGPTNHTQTRSNRLSLIISFSFFLPPPASPPSLSHTHTHTHTNTHSHKRSLTFSPLHTLNLCPLFVFQQKQTLFLFSFSNIHNLYTIFNAQIRTLIISTKHPYFINSLSSKNMLYT